MKITKPTKAGLCFGRFVADVHCVKEASLEATPPKCGAWNLCADFQSACRRGWQRSDATGRRPIAGAVDYITGAKSFLQLPCL